MLRKTIWTTHWTYRSMAKNYAVGVLWEVLWTCRYDLTRVFWLWAAIRIHCNCCEYKLTAAATNVSKPPFSCTVGEQLKYGSKHKTQTFGWNFVCLGRGEALCARVRDERWWWELQGRMFCDRFSDRAADKVGQERKELPSAVSCRVSCSLCCSFLSCLFEHALVEPVIRPSIQQ